MHTVWQHALSTSGPLPTSGALDDASFTMVPPRRLGDGEDGPTAHSTGLGLPLSRALAKVAGGWLGLQGCLPLPAATAGGVDGGEGGNPVAQDSNRAGCHGDVPAASDPPSSPDSYVSYRALLVRRCGAGDVSHVTL